MCTNKIKIGFILVLIIFTSAVFAKQNILIEAEPGGEYVIKAGKDVKITIIGNGSKEKPFKLTGGSSISRLTGDSFVKILGSHVILENLDFENNLISYTESRGLISIGDDKKKVTNITLRRLRFTGKNKFSSYDGKTQFHFIYINGDGISVKDCVFSHKQNRLPIIHVDAGLKDVNISNSKFQDVKQPISDIAIEAIRVGLGKGHTSLIINNNLFENYWGDSETISIKCDGVNVIDNIFQNSRSGVCVRYGNNCLIKGNLFENVVTPVRLSGRNLRIENNIFKNKNNRSIFFMYGGKDYLQVKDIQIFNNVFWNYFDIYGMQIEGHALPPMNIKRKGNKIFNGLKSLPINDDTISYTAQRRRILVKTSSNNKVKEYILK